MTLVSQILSLRLTCDRICIDLSSLLCFNTVACQYQWACTEPDEIGQRYIPSVMPELDVFTEPIASGIILVYPVPNLSSNCYGTVTAIEYCYRYTGTNQAMFDWTVLILEDTGNHDFVINHIYNIQGRGSMSSANCTSDRGQITCCNRTSVENFNLSVNFAFGVTASAHGATLLGVHNTVQQYSVNATVVNKNEVTLSMNRTIRRTSPEVRGIQMLWFVIGKHAQSLIFLIMPIFFLFFRVTPYYQL